MAYQPYLRIFGYVTTLALHISNLAVMQNMQREDLASDIRIKAFRGTMYRYFTCWTVMLQILYAVLGLVCDVMLLRNSQNKKYKLPKLMSSSREILFGALVWPCSMVVFTVFWSLYNYDRSLIFPEFIDKIISNTTNHILHSAIVPIMLWEIVWRARNKPRSHARNIAQLIVHILAYLAVLYYTYFDKGIWLYPIFEVAYRNSIHFILLHVVIGILLLFFYYLQWILNYILHGSQDKIKKKLR